MLIGIIIRVIAIKTLTQSYLFTVAIRKDYKLHTSGIYNYIIHPGYLGMLISFIGIAFTFRNLISLALIIGFNLISIIYRITIEEKALLEEFGIEYAEYSKKTKRLFFFY